MLGSLNRTFLDRLKQKKRQTLFLKKDCMQNRIKNLKSRSAVMSNPVHKRLKKLTKPFHEELEECVFPKKLAAGKMTQGEYKNYMQVMHQFHSQTEPYFLEYSEWTEFGIEIHSRLRTQFLKEDLKNLGISDPQPFRPGLNVRRPLNFAQSAGMLYVLEGSTMGGMILSKKADELFFDRLAGSCTRYFSAYREETIPKWQQYCSFLNNYYISHPDSEDDIISGACICFMTVKRFLDALSD